MNNTDTKHHWCLAEQGECKERTKTFQTLPKLALKTTEVDVINKAH